MLRTRAPRLRFPVRLQVGIGAALWVGLVMALLPAGGFAQGRATTELDDAQLIQRVEAALTGAALADAPPVKCMVPHLVEMQARGYELAALPREIAADDTLEYLTPDGIFRVEYYATGIHAVDLTDADLSGVPDYVEWVGQAMQESWAHEVGQLGFPAIPLAEGERYRVQVRKTPGYYGWTNYANVTDPGGSNIVINADFAAFYVSNPSLLNDDPDGLIRGAIRVTCAHEFKHALQVAAGWNVSEIPLWVEVDATAMEDLVYDAVNDYYNYIRNTGSPFVSPQTSLISASYEDVTWHLFLFEKYGIEFLSDFSAFRGAQPIVPGFTAYLETAEGRQIPWQDLWREYAVWNFLTAERATASRGFDEAAAYPLAPTQAIAPLPHGPASSTLAPWANRFHVFDNSARTESGGVRVVFTHSLTQAPYPWGVALVLQRADLTTVVPMPITAITDTLETQGIDVADYDRIAVVVGNGRPAANTFDVNPYTLRVELRPIAPNDFGTLKRIFSGRSER